MDERLLYLADREKELRDSIMRLFRVKWGLQEMVQEAEDRDTVYHLLRSQRCITDAVTAILVSEYNAVHSELLAIIEGELYGKTFEPSSRNDSEKRSSR